VLRPAVTEHDGVPRVLPAGFEDFEFHTVDRNAGGLGKIDCHAGILPTETGHLLTGFRGSVVGVRADRLMAILLLLQQREQVTAAEVARELEISERTARRDLDALGMAGGPVYSIQGRGGGWRLVGGARTDLSGLTASEARALFLVAGPASSARPAVKAALRKLVQAMPEPFRVQAEAAASSLVLDPQRWGSSRVEPRPPRFLDEIQDAKRSLPLESKLNEFRHPVLRLWDRCHNAPALVHRPNCGRSPATPAPAGQVASQRQHQHIALDASPISTDCPTQRPRRSTVKPT
jgi:biotin operon repressor